jgi:hypothetical protein
MNKADPQMLKTLATHVNAAGALLDAIEMGLVSLTPGIISSTVWTLRHVADRLEQLESAAAKEGT